MPGERGAHQGLMDRRTHSLDREGELFGNASVPFPSKFDQAGDPVSGADNLGSDGGKGEVVRKAMTPAHKSISCPSRPMVGRVKNPVQGGPFTMLDNVRESLVPLAPCVGRLEEVLELRRLQLFGPASYLSGKDLFQFPALGEGPGRLDPHVGPTVVEAF